MDKALKQRLVGASVLIILAVIVLPMLLSGRSDTLNTESRRIQLPAEPEELSFKTRRFPVGVPARAVAPGVNEPGVNEPVVNEPAVKQATGQAGGNSLAPKQLAGHNAGPPVAEAGAQQAGAVEPEPATVTVTSVEAMAKTAPAATTEPVGSEPDRPRYLVQVASFSSEKRANAMAAELRAKNMPVLMDVVDRTGGRLHRVRVGPYVGRAEADTVVVQIRSMNQDLHPRIMDTRPGDGAPVSTPSDPLVRWVIQVGSYSSAATAEAEVARLRLADLPAFSEKVSSADRIAYKVRIGPEIDRARAVQLAKDIKARLNIDSFVTTQD